MKIDRSFDGSVRRPEPLHRGTERFPRTIEPCLLQSIPDCGSHAAEALNEAADLWAALGEHAIVVTMDWRGAVTFASDRFCAVSRFTRAELLGRDHPLFAPGSRCFDEFWEAITEGKAWHGEAQLQAKDGSPYWLASTIVPFFDHQGIPRKFVAIHSDITEQKRTQAELSEWRHVSQLIADLPSRFAAVPADHIDSAIEDTMRRRAEALDLDFGVLLQKSEPEADAELTHLYSRHCDAASIWLPHGANDLPWSFEEVLGGEPLSSSGVVDAHRLSVGEADQPDGRGRVCGVSLPLVVNGSISGALAFGVLDREREWRERDLIELQITAHVIGNVIGRQREERRERQLCTHREAGGTARTP